MYNVLLFQCYDGKDGGWIKENDYRIFLHDKLIMLSLLVFKRFVYASLPAGCVTRNMREM